MDADLTTAELALIEHVRRGEVFAPAETPTLRASVLRDIARGLLVTDPDPHGLQVEGATIEGRLDLDQVSTELPLVFIGCAFPAGLTAQGARLSRLTLRGCVVGCAEHMRCAIALSTATIAQTLELSDSRIDNTAGCAVEATGVRVGGYLLFDRKFSATGSGPLGAVRLTNARVDGEIVFDGATLTNDSGPALVAEGLNAERSTLLLRAGFAATGNGPHAAVNLFGAKVLTVEFIDATVRNDSGSAVAAERIKITDAFLFRNTTAVGGGRLGAVQLDSAVVGGQCDFTNSAFTNHTGPGLSMERAVVTDSLFLNTNFAATGAGGAGAVCLFGARIGGEVDATTAVLRNDSGPALNAEAVTVGMDLRLNSGFTATGAGQASAVDLDDAEITGSVLCSDAYLTNESGPALTAKLARVGKDFVLADTKAVGVSEAAAIQLLGSQVGGLLDARGMTVRNSRGTAFDATSVTVGRDLYLYDGFTASGGGVTPAVRLTRSHIHGQAALTGATISNPTGPALTAYGLQVGQDLFLDDGFTAHGGGEGKNVVNLNDVHASGLVFEPAELVHATDPTRRLKVDGLRYAGLPQGIDTNAWLHLLRSGTSSYAAQPYQHLAAAHRAAGHDREMRRILMTQRRDQVRRRALAGRGERAWARFTGVVLGYGYQPWRALVGLAAAVLVSVLLTVLLGGQGGLVATPADQSVPAGSTAAAACPSLDRVGLGLDVGTPLLSTGARARCTNTTTAAGQALTVSGWLLRLLAWTFATLFVAGFTGAVRKT